MRRRSIFFIGECMVELQRAERAMDYRFGGDTLNAAVYLSRLIERAARQSEFEVCYVTAIGTDTLSDEMAAMWQVEGLATQWVQRLPDKLPGMYLIETDALGERRFHFWRNDSAARYWMQGACAPQVLQALAAADVVYLSGISLAILTPVAREQLLTVLAACRRRGGTIVFDNNYRPRLWESAAVAASVYQRVLAQTDIALLTLDDENLVYGEADVEAVIARTRQLGVQEIVIKRGALSCIVNTPDAQIDVAALPVSQVIDTTAAGDSFGAAYLATRLMGGNVDEAARAGHRLAAAVIGQRGAIIPRSVMPD